MLNLFLHKTVKKWSNEQAIRSSGEFRLVSWYYFAFALVLHSSFVTSSSATLGDMPRRYVMLDFAGTKNKYLFLPKAKGGDAAVNKQRETSRHDGMQLKLIRQGQWQRSRERMKHKYWGQLKGFVWNDKGRIYFINIMRRQYFS